MALFNPCWKDHWKLPTKEHKCCFDLSLPSFMITPIKIARQCAWTYKETIKKRLFAALIFADWHYAPGYKKIKDNDTQESQLAQQDHFFCGSCAICPFMDSQLLFDFLRECGKHSPSLMDLSLFPRLNPWHSTMGGLLLSGATFLVWEVLEWLVSAMHLIYGFLK